MPLFEYECQECRLRFELLRMTKEEENDLRCPQCGAADIVKLLSSFSSRSNSGGSQPTSCSSSSFT